MSGISAGLRPAAAAGLGAALADFSYALVAFTIGSVVLARLVEHARALRLALHPYYSRPVPARPRGQDPARCGGFRGARRRLATAGFDLLPDPVDAFLKEIGQSVGRPAAGVSPTVVDKLIAYPWPGNVRELRNAIERAVILCEGGLITSDHLPLGIVSPRMAAAAARATVATARIEKHGLIAE